MSKTSSLRGVEWWYFMLDSVMPMPLVSVRILVGSRRIAVAGFSGMRKRSRRHRLDKVRLGAK